MNLRALEKVARIGCKYQSLFSLHTLGAPLLRTCTGAAVLHIFITVQVKTFLCDQRLIIKRHHSFIIFDFLNLVKQEAVNLCESSVRYGMS